MRQMRRIEWPITRHDLDEALDESSCSAADLLELEQDLVFLKAWELLTVEQRQWLDWFFTEKRSWREIGARVGISEDAARMRHIRTMREFSRLVADLRGDQ